MSNHSRGFTSRRHPELDSGSSRIFNKGFTLLEVLVVVIIIAVLAAVAVPQYQKAALKSRFSTVMPMAKAVADAQEVYYLGRNMYALGSDELDVTPVSAEKTSVQLSSEETPAVSDDYIYVSAKRTDVPGARYIVYQKHSPKFANTIQCEADVTNEQALWLCEKGLKGQDMSGSVKGDGYKTFLLAGTTGDDTFATDEQKEEENTSNSCQEGDSVPGSVQTAMNTMLQTAQTNSGNEGISVTANCVNGKWEYDWSGGDRFYGDDYRAPENAYELAGSLFEDSQCDGEVAYGCSGIVFERSNCYGRVENGCSGSIFIEGAACNGQISGGCNGAIFRNGGHCYDEEGTGCAGAIFEDGSFCVSQVDGGCTSVDWHLGSYCTEGSSRCPAGSPAGDWDGIHAGKCWDGNGGEVDC